MTNAGKLEAIPPRPSLTRRQQAERVIGRLLLAAALILASLALGKALQALACLNSSLGERGTQGQQYDHAVGDAFTVIYLTSQGVLPKDQAQKRLIADSKVVDRVAHYRDTHPLGRC